MSVDSLDGESHPELLTEDHAKAAVKVVGCHHGSPTHRNERPGRGQVVFNGLAREMKSSVNLKTSCRPDSGRSKEK